MNKSNLEPGVISFTRRSFLQTSAVGVGGLFALSSVSGLVVGCNGGGTDLSPPVTEADLNAWVQIQPDNTTVITIGFSEMGQGVYTALPMLIAEELDADWSKVRVEMPRTGSVFNNNIYETQVTAGSTSMVSAWIPLREAGAKLRQLLLQAFVNQFGGTVAELTTANSVVTNTNSGQTATYGELAAAASLLTPSEDDVALKEPSQWTLIGQPLARLDIPEKVDGTAVFGIDVEIDNMLIGTIMHCPVLGGSVKSFNRETALAIEGVREVVDVGNGVVVVADGYWPAHEGARALFMQTGQRWNGAGYSEGGVEWDYGPNTEMNTKQISKRLRFGLHFPGLPIFKKGSRGVTPARTIEAVYEVPFLAHGALEPMNCTADVQADRCEIWVPTQAQNSTQVQVAELLGFQPHQVTVHTTFLGGGFGRRLNVDFILQAVKASQAVGQPVKLIWSREEDTRHDFYRPAAVARIRAGLDRDNNLVTWENRIVAPPFVPDWLGLDEFPEEAFVNDDDASIEALESLIEAQPEALESHIETLEAQADSLEIEAEAVPEGLIEDIVEKFIAGFIASEGAVVERSEAASDAMGHRARTALIGLPYNIPNERVVYVPRKKRIDVPLGFWRAVGPSYNMFFIETMIDEVAEAAGQDPVAFRGQLLAGQNRFLTVLHETATRANWGSTPAGRFQGMAFFRGFSSISAQVAEISVEDNKPIVHKITCVVDCGPVVNPDIAASQVVGAIVFGLTAAFYGTISIEQGRVLEANFDNYRLLTLSEMPEVDVHFIANTNEDQIGGLGEVGTPLVAPAVANAIFAATGQRIRTLPIRLS